MDEERSLEQALMRHASWSQPDMGLLHVDRGSPHHFGKQSNNTSQLDPSDACFTEALSLMSLSLTHKILLAPSANVIYLV